MSLIEPMLFHMCACVERKSVNQGVFTGVGN